MLWRTWWTWRLKLPSVSVYQLAAASLKYFTVKLLGLKWPQHYQEWYELIEKHDRILFQAPRGHGKSVFLSGSYPLWRVFKAKTEVLLVSYSEDQVVRLIREIKNIVETNPYLEHLRPTAKEIWGVNQLGFSNGSLISGLGFGTSSRGRHPDVIIVDDPLKDLGGMTDEDQERAYFGVITGMAMEKTKLITVGTPVDFNDLLMKLEANPAYQVWKRPALNEAGEPLFPGLWSKAALEQKRLEMGSINFSREYLLERIDPTTQPFKAGFTTFYEVPPENFARIVTVCDPAYTENDGDATAIVTVGFTHGNHAYVLEAKEVRREDPGMIVDELFKTISRFKPDSVGIERKKGDAIAYSFRERRTRENRWDFRYVELSHGGKNKDDMSRIGGLVPRWESHAIHLHKTQVALQQELYRFRFKDTTKGHDDLVDALAYCFHKDLALPNTGKRFVQLPQAVRNGRVLYQVGRATSLPTGKSKPTFSTRDPFKRHEESIDISGFDRRIGDAA
jgi:hypothetical protein